MGKSGVRDPPEALACLFLHKRKKLGYRNIGSYGVAGMGSTVDKSSIIVASDKGCGHLGELWRAGRRTQEVLLLCRKNSQRLT